MKPTTFFWRCLPPGLLIVSSAAIAASLEQRLLDAVHDGSLDRVNETLAQGVDPNATLGRLYDEKPLCLATVPGREPILAALLAAGADANVLYPKADNASVDPLKCAVSNENLDAFIMLHEAGAELERDLCPHCTAPFPNTIIDSAMGSDKHHILRYLIENTTVDSSEERVIKMSLEEWSAYADDPTLPDRAWIVNWLRERGQVVEPQPPR